MRPEAGFRMVANGPKIGKKTMTSQFADIISSPIFCYISLVKFIYWSNFYVNNMIGSGVMTISVYKRLSQNSEFGNTSANIFPNF